jgi:hypothetical protein
MISEKLKIISSKTGGSLVVETANYLSFSYFNISFHIFPGCESNKSLLQLTTTVIFQNFLILIFYISYIGILKNENLIILLSSLVYFVINEMEVSYLI